jgi:NhaP-type Na+/H+ or K+/H+ antiporter
VSFEIIVLGMANALRPTSLACVYALLATREPRRLLTTFVVAGFAFSLATGVIVVSVINGAHIRHGTSTFDAIVNLVAGVAALGFAAGLAQGRLQRRPRPEMERGQSGISKRLRDPSLRVAAGAGVATHLPGLLYLVGLNQISAHGPRLGAAVVDVTVFNAIWWSIPIASLVFFLMRPASTRDGLAAIDAWTQSHDRVILVALFAVVGAYLSVRGAANLLE